MYQHLKKKSMNFCSIVLLPQDDSKRELINVKPLIRG